MITQDPEGDGITTTRHISNAFQPWWIAESTRGHSCTNRCWIFPINGWSTRVCPHPSTSLFSIPDAWPASLPVNGDLIVDSNVRPPGFDLRRHNWVLLNRFRTGQGRCAHFMYICGFVKSPAYNCGAEEQKIRHIVDDCPCPLWLFAYSLPWLWF
jgi:hypothetical protein